MGSAMIRLYPSRIAALIFCSKLVTFSSTFVGHELTDVEGVITMGISWLNLASWRVSPFRLRMRSTPASTAASISLKSAVSILTGLGTVFLTI